jgi:hypothetical protein
MSALFNSLIHALGIVIASIVLVALAWTIYINRQSVADMAAPVVTPLVDSVSGAGALPDPQADREPAKEPAQ